MYIRSLLFILLFMLSQSACKKHSSNDPAPARFEAVTLPISIASDIKGISEVISSISVASKGTIQVIAKKQNSFIIGLDAAGKVLAIGMAEDDKVILNNSNTALALAKIMLMPYSESEVSLQDQVQAIRSSPSFGQLTAAVSYQVEKGQSPIDDEVTTTLVTEVAGEAQEQLWGRVGERKSMMSQTSKHFLFTGLSQTIAERHSFWLEETFVDQSVTEVIAKNNSHLFWKLSAYDESDNQTDSLLIGPVDFPVDFSKITTYIDLTKELQRYPVKHAGKYGIFIYQTEETRQKNLETFYFGVFDILWGLIPFIGREEKCYSDYIAKLIFTTAPKLRERVANAKTKEESLVAISSFFSETLFSDESSGGYEDFIKHMIKCQPALAKGIDADGFLRYVQIKSYLIRKLYNSLLKIINPADKIFKTTKLGLYLYNFATNYNAKFEYRNYIKIDEPVVTFTGLNNCRIEPYGFGSSLVVSVRLNASPLLLAGRSWQLMEQVGTQSPIAITNAVRNDMIISYPGCLIFGNSKSARITLYLKLDNGTESNKLLVEAFRPTGAW